MSLYAYRICRFQDIWQLTGLGARIAVALRLNKMPAYSASYKYEYCTYTAARIELVRIPRDVSDVSDRRAAFWWIYTAERFASAITGWAHFVQDEDIKTLLPSTDRGRPDEADDWHSLSIQSDDFFHSHPKHLVGGLQLFFKATILLGRASRINIRKAWDSNRTLFDTNSPPPDFAMVFQGGRVSPVDPNLTGRLTKCARLPSSRLWSETSTSSLSRRNFTHETTPVTITRHSSLAFRMSPEYSPMSLSSPIRQTIDQCC
jgi:hypothetical protein